MLATARFRFAYSLLLFLVAITPTCAHAAEFDPQAYARQLRNPEPPLSAKITQQLTIPEGIYPHVISFSLDGSHLTAASDLNRIVVWDTKTGELVSPRYLRCAGRVTSLSLSATGKYVLLGRDGGRNALLGECRTGKVVSIYKGLQSDVVTTGFTDDDKFAILVEKNGTVHRFPLLESESEKLVLPLGNRLMSARLSPCGHRAVVTCQEPREIINVQIPSEGPLQAAEPLALTILGYSLTFHKMIFRDHQAEFSLLWLNESGKPTPIVYEEDDLSGFFTLLRDNETILSPGRPNRCHIANLGHMVDSQRIQLENNDQTFGGFTSDGRTFFARNPKLAAYYIGHIEGEFVPPPLHLDRTLARLLRDKQFAAIDQLFAEFADDPQPFSWAPFSSPYNVLCARLANLAKWHVPVEAQLVALEEWQKACPDSAPAKLVRAQKYIHAAWHARGAGYAPSVTPEGWKSFAENIDLARDILLPLAEQEHPAQGVYNLLFTVAMAQSWPDEVCAPFIEKLQKQSPLNVDGHVAIVQKKMVRWGGAPEELSDYAKQIADTIGGDAGDCLYARLACQQACFYYPQQVFVESGLDYDRTKRGLEILAKSPAYRRHAGAYGLYFACEARNAEDLAHLADVYPEVDEYHWPTELINMRKATVSKVNRVLRCTREERAARIAEAIKPLTPPRELPRRPSPPDAI